MDENMEENSLEELIAEQMREWEEMVWTKCPCCGYYTLPQDPDFDICPVCNWEYDRIQFDNPLVWGGANGPSLLQARMNFRRFGACSERDKEFVSPPSERAHSGEDYPEPYVRYDERNDVVYICFPGRYFSCQKRDWRKWTLKRYGEKAERMQDWNYVDCSEAELERFPRLNFREGMRKLSTYELKSAAVTKLKPDDFRFLSHRFGLNRNRFLSMTDDEAAAFWAKLTELADSAEGGQKDRLRNKLEGWASPCWDLPDWMTRW